MLVFSAGVDKAGFGVAAAAKCLLSFGGLALLELPQLARHSFGAEEIEVDVQVVVVGFVARGGYRQG